MMKKILSVVLSCLIILSCLIPAFAQTDNSLKISVISDIQFDTISRQLVALMQSSTEEECEASTYWYCMSTFDASTGFYLYSRLNSRDKQYLRGIASWVLDSYRKYVKWGETDDLQRNGG